MEYTARARWTPLALIKRHERPLLTIMDQGLVSITSFATNFILMRKFVPGSDDYAYYTLAFNLMIWIAEFHAALVFTPHTILSPRKSGAALKRFHGSTLLHHFGVSIFAIIGLLIGAIVTRNVELGLSNTLLILAAGTLVIGLRNYARPYSFTARKPAMAVGMDFAVCILQIGLILLLSWMQKLNVVTSLAAIAAASALPAIIWLLVNRTGFAPSVNHATADLRDEWPNTKWVLLSGVVWVAGMQLYPWLIKSMHGNQEVKLWGACYALAAIANPLLMGLQSFTGPRIAEAFTERSQKKFCLYVYQTAIWTSLLMIGPAILLSIYASPALTWLSHGEFTGHQIAISIICGAIVLQGITFTISRGLFALHRADLDLYCNFGPLVLMFTLGAWLTWRYETTGAAASLLIAQVLSVGSRGILFYLTSGKPVKEVPTTEFPTDIPGEP